MARINLIWLHNGMTHCTTAYLLHNRSTVGLLCDTCIYGLILVCNITLMSILVSLPAQMVVILHVGVRSIIYVLSVT